MLGADTGNCRACPSFSAAPQREGHGCSGDRTRAGMGRSSWSPWRRWPTFRNRDRKELRMTPPVHGRIEGPVVLIGFGAIGRGTLSLVLRHFDCDPSKVTVIDPNES